MQATRLYSRITGTGSGLPQRIVTNDELARELASRGVQTSDEWIVARTGIRQRYVAEPGVTTAELGARAALAALESAGLAPANIDLIVVGTSTPDQIFPSTACLVQARIGALGCAAFDVQAVCSGFVYALAAADALIRTGAHKRALVIGSEVFSRILDWNDRTTCVLFGDGAGAVVLEASSEAGVIAAQLKADGSHAGVLCTAGRVSNGQVEGDPFLRMDGQAVFKLAVNVLGTSALETLAQAKLDPSRLDWLIPHQANVRILKATAKRLGVPEERLVVTVVFRNAFGSGFIIRI